MPYRLEYAKSARGGCQMAACKHADVKLQKGELKFGTLVEGQSSFSEGSHFFQWRHWGCVTEKVLAKVNEEINGDLEMLDGFEDMNDADQNRVAAALAAEHVAPEDVTRFNEEDQRHYDEYLADEDLLKDMKKEAKANGQSFDLKTERERLKNQRLTARRAAQQEAVAAEKANAKAAKEAEKAAKKSGKGPVKAGSKRKQVKDEDDEEEADQPAPKKRTKANPKVKKEVSDEEEIDQPAPKKRARATTKVKKEDSEEDEDPPARTKSTRTKKVVKTEPQEDETDGSPEPVKPKAKTSRKSKATKAESDVEEAQIAKTKARANGSRSKKQVKAESEGEDEEETPLVVKSKAKGRAPKRTKA